MTLFTKMPKIEYNGYILTDISKRLAIKKTIKNNNNVFQYYDIVGHESAEQLAQDFYGDPSLVWLIYLMNDIIDPFYGWLLNDNALASFTEDKYGVGNENIIHHYTMDGIIITNIPIHGFSSVLSHPSISISSVLGQLRKETITGTGTKNTAVGGLHQSTSKKYYAEYRINSGSVADFVFGLGITSVEGIGLDDYDATTMSFPADTNQELGISLQRIGGDFRITENFDGVKSAAPQNITTSTTNADNFGLVLDLDTNSVQFYKNGVALGGQEFIPASRQFDDWRLTLTTTTGTAQLLDSTEQEYFLNVQALDPDIIPWQTKLLHETAFPVTNKTHEENINDSKRKVKIIRPDFITSILNELKALL